MLVTGGLLPMTANVLAVGMPIGQRYPASRPFLLWLEAFGVTALVLCVALAMRLSFSEVVIPIFAPFVAPVERYIGPGRPFVYIPIGGLVVAVVLLDRSANGFRHR